VSSHHLVETERLIGGEISRDTKDTRGGETPDYRNRVLSHLQCASVPGGNPGEEVRYRLQKASQ